MIETPINPEVKKQQFRDRSNEVLEREVTVENINSYMDDAVSDLIRLTDELVESYKADTPDIDPDLSDKEIEDLAYAAYSLLNINDYLDTAQKKIKELEEIDSFIGERIVHISEVITPPSKDIKMPARIGEEVYARPGTKNRLKTLLYVLKENGVDFEKIQIREGVIDKDMMRWLSYFSIEISDIDRLILVCDEERNASYIFDTEKLKQSGLSTNDINNMSKPELNQLIADHPGIGVRFIQNKNWRDRLEGFLLEKIPSQEITDQDLPEKEDTSGVPKVSAIELDPWKGFWAESKRKHWGAIRTIANYVGLSKNSISKIAKFNNLERKKIKDLAGHPIDCYCYEEIEKLLQEWLSIPQVAKDGEWKGFWAESEGKHWGAIRTIAKRFGVAWVTISKIAKPNNLERKKIRDLGGHPTDCYCYEEIERLVQELLSTPRVAKEGEWRGFWAESEGKHWGAIRTIAKRFGIGHGMVLKVVKNNNPEGRKILDVLGHKRDGYCYEEIERLVQELLSTPRVAKEGEWRGFWAESEGKHWGGVYPISKRLGFNYSLGIAKFNNLERKKIRDLSERQTDGYCYEELEEKFRR